MALNSKKHTKWHATGASIQLPSSLMRNSAAAAAAAAAAACLHSAQAQLCANVQDSQDPNPLIRALAVRTMGCIRVDKITEYLCDPLQRCLKVRFNTQFTALLYLRHIMLNCFCMSSLLHMIPGPVL